MYLCTFVDSLNPAPPTDCLKEIDFDEILEKHVGGWGRYQWQYLFVFAIVTMYVVNQFTKTVLQLYVMLILVTELIVEKQFAKPVYSCNVALSHRVVR
jgi:hypothetical protein